MGPIGRVQFSTANTLIAIAFAVTTTFLLVDPLLAVATLVPALCLVGMCGRRAALRLIPVARAMKTGVRTLSPRDLLERAMELILDGAQEDFPIVEGDRPVGVLSRDAAFHALARHGAGVEIGRVMRRCDGLPDTTSLADALARLAAGELPVLPVVRDGHLVGMLTPAQAGEAVLAGATTG